MWELKVAAAVVLTGGSIAATAMFVDPQVFDSVSDAPASTNPYPGLPAAAQDGGYALCRQTMPGVDCACFAQKTTQVLANSRTRVTGYSYTDPWDLARTQARASCS